MNKSISLNRASPHVRRPEVRLALEAPPGMLMVSLLLDDNSTLSKLLLFHIDRDDAMQLALQLLDAASLKRYGESMEQFHVWMESDKWRDARLHRYLSGQPLDAAAADDEAIGRFAAALKVRLAEARAKGRSGWEDRKRFSSTALSDMLLAHVFKGDPCDVANFAMFLHQRGESITLSAAQFNARTSPDAEV